MTPSTKPTNSSDATARPRIALTMGDVAGIGPEIIARACSTRELRTWCRPIVVGHPEVLARGLKLVGNEQRIVAISTLDELPDAAPDNVSADNEIVCWNPTEVAADMVPIGQLDARAGRAAYDYLVAAARAALANQIDAITTAPLNKAALKLGGLNYPGHTEILAEECGVDDFGMMLYLPQGGAIQSPHGLGVVHVTLHTSIRSVPDLLSTDGVAEKVGLIAEFMSRMGAVPPRVAVCALNPHAGENGLFGDEEARIIAPAVERMRLQGLDAQGPFPADTLLRRAVAGEFDAVVAMYHDQGHIALKLIGFDRAVNITLGLPIVRTSPSHGTAFDIAGQGRADAEGLLQAIRVAAMLCQDRAAT